MPLLGIGLMLVGTAFLSWNDAVAKSLSASLPVGEIVCLRQIVALGVAVAYGLFTLGPSCFRVVNHALQVWRGLAFVASTLFIVAALAALPIPLVTAIAFASPIGVAALSVPLLGERVSLRRWLAVLTGFAGVLVVIRPGGASFTWLLLLPVAAAVASAMRDGLTRKLSPTDSAISILIWSSVMVILAAALTAMLGDWKPLDAHLASWIVINGVLNAAAHFLMISAYRHGDAALISPFRYSGLMWAALLGWFVWRDWPDTWTVAGALIIIVSSFYAAGGGKAPVARAPEPAPSRG
jgi:drug/metabolite transporter (DMT)-like permease